MTGEDMNRREIVLSVAGLASLALTTSAKAQQLPDEIVSAEELAERLTDPAALDRVLLDVAYFHSWRVDRAPRGYESDSGWRPAALENWILLRNALSDGRAPAIVTDARDELAAFQERSLKAYVDNREAFQRFLSDIGLIPDGAAAMRMVMSLRDYGLLNAAVLKADVASAEKYSFFWPFC